MSIAWQIIVSGLISSTLLALEHFMLGYVLRVNLHVVFRYVSGILALYVPLSVLLWHSPPLGVAHVLAAWWGSTIITGVVVAGLHLLGALLEARRRADAAEAQLAEGSASVRALAREALDA